MNELIKELEELLDPMRLKQTRFGNEAGLVVSNGLTYRQIHALRKEGRVSPFLFNVLKDIAPPADRPRLPVRSIQVPGVAGPADHDHRRSPEES